MKDVRLKFYPSPDLGIKCQTFTLMSQTETRKVNVHCKQKEIAIMIVKIMNKEWRYTIGRQIGPV